jgi:hypothetical protein
VNSLPIIDDLSGFVPTAILIGEGQRADRVWTREEFVLLCNLMRNDNPADEFLHVYCDSNGGPRFVKAKSVNVEKRITWAWDTITGKAKHKVSIGFYPWNCRGESDGRRLTSMLTTAVRPAQWRSRSRHVRSCGNIRSFH